MIAALKALRHPKSSAAALKLKRYVTQTQALCTKLKRCAPKRWATQIQVQQAPEFEAIGESFPPKSRVQSTKAIDWQSVWGVGFEQVTKTVINGVWEWGSLLSAEW